ncbi:class I SAM-dependent methyltransferase [Nocardia anaemiae]|uniref:class I SAM-dependent methyltransferase n=1 Tax=Nocardia anaemiae TaxID=263910 RepID=UPI0007A43D04|nr:class I SAM-dependent methyltransferase [Nocardia anaemiae]
MTANSRTDPADVAHTRAAYDDLAIRYAEFVKGHLATQPFDRAMLATFAELVRDGGRVADLGCGEGRLTAHLSGLGLDIFGIDLSPELLALARAQYPTIDFAEGSLEHLDIGDATLAGILVWYSIIHLPPERMPAVLAEFHRLLEPGGHALLAFFHAPDVEGVEPFDHKVITAYRWSPDRLATLAEQVGFTPTARLIREPDPGERGRQAYLLLAKDR